MSGTAELLSPVDLESRAEAALDQVIDGVDEITVSDVLDALERDHRLLVTKAWARKMLHARGWGRVRAIGKIEPVHTRPRPDIVELAPADTRHWQWWVGLGLEPERYELNAATRDEAIATGHREYGSLETFTIVEATQDGPFDTDDLITDEVVELVIDRFAEENHRRFGEDGFEGDIDQETLRAALNAAAAKHIGAHAGDIVTFTFTEQRNKEVIGPESLDAQAEVAA